MISPSRRQRPKLALKFYPKEVMGAVIKELVPLELEKHALGYYKNFEVDASVRMHLVDAVGNQTQTALSNKRVLLVPAQGTVPCQRHYFSHGQGRLPTAPRAT